MSERNPFTSLRAKIDSWAAGHERPRLIQAAIGLLQAHVESIEEHYQGALEALDESPAKDTETRLRNVGARLVQIGQDGSVMINGQDQKGVPYTVRRGGLFKALESARDLYTGEPLTARSGFPAAGSIPPAPPWHEQRLGGTPGSTSLESAGGMDLGGPAAPENQQAAASEPPPESA